MIRGSTIKRDTATGVVLERRMLTRRYWFEWSRETCVGCGTCAKVCPKEAITMRQGRVEDGRLVERPGIEIDAAKCVFCGECVLLCPVHALTMTVNGQPEIPVVVWEAFPQLIRDIVVREDRLSAAQAAACVEACPPRVISVEGETNAAGALETVTAVRVDEAGCTYCKQCEALCPDTFSVTSPWEGRIALNVSLCPPGCRACVDICPTRALTWGDGQVELDKRFCLYCGACENVCPVSEAITVQRSAIRHYPVKSSAWTKALESLISIDAAVREIEVKSQGKRRQVAQFLPGAKRSSP